MVLDSSVAIVHPGEGILENECMRGKGFEPLNSFETGP